MFIIGIAPHASLQQVRLDDHTAVLRLLADRRHDLTRLRTQTVCRLHALLCLLTPGGLPVQLSAERATKAMRSIRPTDPIDVERKAMAADLLVDIRRLDHRLETIRTRIVAAVYASGTTVTDIHGIGPIMAAVIVGHTGHVSRFPTAGHYARYNATAPIEASSGPKIRHRLNPRGNRRLNHALHTQQSPRSATTRPAARTPTARSLRARPAKKPSAH